LKRKCSISAIAVSTVLFLILAVIPHHHHRGVACVVIEQCEQDNAVNDEHTHHNDTDDGESHNGICIVESEFITPSSLDETKSKVFENLNDNTSLFLILFLAGDLFNSHLANLFIESDYGEYILNYTSVEASQSHSLRAPPAIFF